MTNITLRAPAVLGRTAFDQLFEQFFPRPPTFGQANNGWVSVD